MKSKDLQPLKVSLHGMDERMQKMMVNYLKLPCRGTAIVVDDNEAHAEIVDVDLTPSKSLLEERLAQQPAKPIIALSLNEISTSGVIYVKKPIEVPDVLAAFDVTRDALLGKTSLEKTKKPTDAPLKTASPPALKEVKAPTPKKPKAPAQKEPENLVQEQPKAPAQKAPENLIQERPKVPVQKAPENLVQKQPKAPVQTYSEPSEDVSDIITRAMQKAEADRNLAPQADDLSPKTALDNYTKQHVEKTQDLEKPKRPKPQKSADDEHISPKKPTKKSEIKSSSDQPEALKQPTVEPTISTDQVSTTEPDKKLQSTTEKPKSTSADKRAPLPSSSGFLDILQQRKGLIAGLTCLITLIAGIYISLLTPQYEARSRIFISANNAKNIAVNPSSPGETLDPAVAQQKINEITSRQLVSRVIKTLQLSTIPEFIAAADTLSDPDSASTLRQERQTAEQLSSITDYFLQNLKASQLKNSPIITIDYRSEDPKLAAKIATQVANDYVAMQQDKKIEVANQLADWETNKLPAAKNKVKQSQDALELYIEMNKWSQFEQQFAEDMGVNSEIRALEKKLKADLALYEVFQKRFENLKQDSDLVTAKLLSSAESPDNPSSPNKLLLLLITLLSAALTSILIAYLLPALNFAGGKAVGAPM